MVLERSPNGEDTLHGECEFCEWTTITSSYPELVRQYQTHLRERHPTAWLRG